jgi:hypothetical protein
MTAAAASAARMTAAMVSGESMLRTTIVGSSARVSLSIPSFVGVEVVVRLLAASG